MDDFKIGDRVCWEVGGETLRGEVTVIDGPAVYVMPDWKTPDMCLLGVRWESACFVGWRKRQLRKDAPVRDSNEED